MKKMDVVRAIQAKTVGYNQTQVQEILDAFSEVIIETLKNDRDEVIPMVGVGKFKAKHCSERTGFSALGAERKPWTVPAHDEITFSVSKSVKTL